MNYTEIPKTIEYKDSETEHMMCFRYYDPDKLVMGKPMKDHLKFAFSWWHTLCAEGTDIFGGATMDKSFGAVDDPIARAKAKNRHWICADEGATNLLFLLSRRRSG